MRTAERKALEWQSALATNGAKDHSGRLKRGLSLPGIGRPDPSESSSSGCDVEGGSTHSTASGLESRLSNLQKSLGKFPNALCS